VPYQYEIIFVNDGSTDGTKDQIDDLARDDPRIIPLEFPRNFGKEIAVTAGLHHARGEAAIILDSDLQHPVELIPSFLAKWREGSDVVIGVRNRSRSDGFIRKLGSTCFYNILNLICDPKLIPQSTDYRLVDRAVIDEFNNFTERNRITRGLIDWLGFTHDFLYFDANARQHGRASYSKTKLIHLALTSFISLSLVPLRLAACLGVVIVFLSGILGIVMLVDRYIRSLGFNFSGPAILANIVLFLVGLLLISIGLLAFYIGHIYQEVQNRPLYVLRKRQNSRNNDSCGIL
jgi:dolichol-phosphate mannosyltransferase